MVVGTAVVPGLAGAEVAAALGETARFAESAEAVGGAARLAAATQRGEKIAAEASALQAAVTGDTTTAYRVEGAANRRVLIDEHGNVEIPKLETRKGAERNLYLNFGDEDRARAFEQQRLRQFPDSETKRFEIHTSFVDELRAHAVPEIDRALHPQCPVIADPTKAADQFGLPGPWIERLRGKVVPQSGAITRAAVTDAATGSPEHAVAKALWTASVRPAADATGSAARSEAASMWAASAQQTLQAGSRIAGPALAATAAWGTTSPSHAPAAQGVVAQEHPVNRPPSGAPLQPGAAPVDTRGPGLRR